MKELEVGQLVWVINAQRVVQLTIVGTRINKYGTTYYIMDNGSTYTINEIGETKKELRELFFGDDGNYYRHKMMR